MHRLLFLLGALALALYGQHLLRADEFAPYVLRDGLLLSAAASILFAFHTLPLPHPPTGRTPAARSPISTTLLTTGILCGLTSTLLFASGISLFALAPLRTTLWLLGIASLLIGGVWPHAGTGLGALTHRWRKGEGGTFVRVPIAQMEEAPLESTSKFPSTTGAEERETLLSPVLEWGLLALLTGLALLLRVWDLYALPARCLAEECARLVELAGVSGTVPWYATAPTEWLLQLILRSPDADVRTVRLFGALLGTITIPAWYGFVRQFVRPSGALAAVALLALSPWHIRASAAADPWIALPLLIALGGWSLLGAWRAERPYASVLVALSWGLLLAEGASGQPALLLWPMLLWLLLGCATGALVLRKKTMRQRLGYASLWGLGALAVAGPWLVARRSLLGGAAPLPDGAVWMPLDFGTALLRGLADGAASTGNDPLLGALTAALFLLGIGAVLRWLYVPRALFVLSGAVLCAIATRHSAAPLDSAFLPLLPLLYALAALALDPLVTVFQRTWRFVVPPQRVAVALPVLLLLLAFPAALGTLGKVNLSSSAADSAVGSAMGRYLAEALAEADAAPALYFIPPSFLNDAGLRAEVGADFQALVDAGTIRPLDPVPDLYFTPAQTAAAEIVYLVPVREGALLDLLGQLYPDTVPQMQMSEAGIDGASTQPIFSAFPVSASQIASVQGVQGTFFPTAVTGSTSVPATVRNSADLAFDWVDEPSFPAPFTARWVGLLLIPEAGNYRLFVDFPSPAAGENGNSETVRLHLDGRLLLDSAVGVVERQEALAQGAYRLELLYQSGGPDAVSHGFEILWQPPGGSVEAIPTELLRNTPGAGDGLVGTYFANREFSGPSLDVRKDPLIGMAAGMVATLPEPYSVRWNGLLATARAGEYLFGGVSSGHLTIAINGRTVATKEAVDPAALAGEGAGDNADGLNNSYAEGLIYLPMGWHTVQIEYAPPAEGVGAGEELQLFWQPPGGSPDRLPTHYLTSAMNAPAPTTLPAPPTLADPTLGNERFALTVAPEYRNPQTLNPPDLLPPLATQMLWQSGSCGGGDLQFNGPRGVAVDPVGGRVYVADPGNRRLVVFELDGTFVTHIESEEFQEPFDVDLLPAGTGASAGTPLVLDALAQQIWRIEISEAAGGGESPGEIVISPLPLDTSFYRPRGFSVDPASGAIGVADTGGGRVVMLTADGSVLIEFGGRETAIGRGQPVDVLFANERFWGITAENGRLWRLDTSLPGSIPSLLAVQPANTFDAPHFAGLPDGSFFLTDPSRRTILYYTAEGQPVGQWPLSDAFVLPVGIGAAVIDGSVNVAVTDSAACTVSLWRVDL